MSDRMALVIDRLFQRLAATYGSAWERSLGDVPMADIKMVWSIELSAFAQSLPRLAWALENLPPRPPNAIEFRALCRQAPAPEVLALPAPAPDPERAREAFAKLAQPVEKHDHKAWARAIVQKAQGGLSVNPTALVMARTALRGAA